MTSIQTNIESNIESQEPTKKCTIYGRNFRKKHPNYQKEYYHKNKHIWMNYYENNRDEIIKKKEESRISCQYCKKSYVKPYYKVHIESKFHAKNLERYEKRKIHQAILNK